MSEDYPETLAELDEEIKAVAAAVCHEASSIGQGVQDDTTPLYWATRRLTDLVDDRRLWREER